MPASPRPAWYEFWPLILVAFGVRRLFGAPGAIGVTITGFNWFLIGSGLLLMLFTMLQADQTLIIGSAILLIALGLLLFWHRSR
jgi:ABC-type nickel/cobalt efflux system permease component RcnA